MPEGLGCLVSAVGSGEEAVAYVRTYPLDLLLFLYENHLPGLVGSLGGCIAKARRGSE